MAMTERERLAVEYALENIYDVVSEYEVLRDLWEHYDIRYRERCIYRANQVVMTTELLETHMREIGIAENFYVLHDVRMMRDEAKQILETIKNADQRKLEA